MYFNEGSIVHFGTNSCFCCDPSISMQTITVTDRTHGEPYDIDPVDGQESSVRYRLHSLTFREDDRTWIRENGYPISFGHVCDRVQYILIIFTSARFINACEAWCNLFNLRLKPTSSEFWVGTAEQTSNFFQIGTYPPESKFPSRRCQISQWG